MSLTLIEKINLLQDARRESIVLDDIEKYTSHAKTLLDKALLKLSSGEGFNSAAYMVAYSLLTIFLPFSLLFNHNSGFWKKYRSELEQMVDISDRFGADIKRLDPKFLFDISIKRYSLVGTKSHSEEAERKKEQRETRAFEAIKERIANTTFSDSPRDVRERPKFYLRFKLSENGLPEGRFKEAIVGRAKNELYQFKTTNSDESYITSYCLIYVIMPMLGHVDNSLVEDWLKIKQRHGRK